jgi:Fur family peroxide stress response transcriptional regulator
MSKSGKDKLRAAFARTGLRCTAQRFAVLEHLSRDHEHPTADQIYLAINRSDPRASRATVYNNLHALIRAGMVREVVLAPGAVRYDANIGHHHHFICEACGGLEDIDSMEASRLARPIRLGARQVRKYEIVFRGLCERCSSVPAQDRRRQWER